MLSWSPQRMALPAGHRGELTGLAPTLEPPVPLRPARNTGQHHAAAASRTSTDVRGGFVHQRFAPPRVLAMMGLPPPLGHLRHRPPAHASACGDRTVGHFLVVAEKVLNVFDLRRSKHGTRSKRETEINGKRMSVREVGGITSWQPESECLEIR
jgi:hypothetical protein